MSNLYLNGTNGDLWRMMKLCLDPIKQYGVFLKAKSHVDDPADWEEHGMTIHTSVMLVQTELLTFKQNSTRQKKELT